MDTKQEIVEGETGELAIIPTIDPDVTLDVFAGLSETPVTQQQSAILLADANPEELDILPTGEVYPPQVMVRRRLNRAFGPAGWGMRPLSRPKVSGNQLAQEWALYVNGRFISYTVGGAEYQSNNPRLSWSDATESLKSNALVRCCKDLGMFSECWDHRWTENWKRTYAVKVFVTQKDNSVKALWRRLDKEPFYKETGVTDDSPNKDKYKASKQTATQKPVTAKSSDNGSQPPQPEPITPEPPAPEPAGVASELDQHFGTPKITEQGAAKVMVKIWDGKEWGERPADEHIKQASAQWFVRTFIGQGKAFDHQYALFGNPDPKKNNIGHLGKYYGRRNFINPKDHDDALTYREFEELVSCAWWKQGDKEHGTLSLPRYQDKIKEELERQDAIPYDEPPKPNGVPTTYDVVAERAGKLGVDVKTLAEAAFGVGISPTERQLQTLWQVLDAVELGNVKAEDFDGQLEMIVLN